MLKKHQAIEILECLRGDLKRLLDDEKTVAGSRAFVKWHYDAETALGSIFPTNQRHLERFQRISFEPMLGVPSEVTPEIIRAVLAAPRQAFVVGMHEADAILHSITEEVRTYWSEDGTSLNPHGLQPVPKPDPSTVPVVKDPSVVFVVHGRNDALREAMFTFLAAIGLHPLEWSEARAATGEATPYIGRILDCAFSMAQAVVVLMTPDDEAQLKEEFRKQEDHHYEKAFTGQARPNVLFEAGIAVGRAPNRTILVEVGTLRPFSDVAGRHTVRLDDSTPQRQELALRLKTAGCPVRLEGTRWHTVGSFELKTVKEPGLTSLEQIFAAIDLNKVAQEDPKPEELDPIALKALVLFFDKANNLSANEIGKHLQLVERSAADYQIDLLLERRFIQRSHTEPKGWAPLYKITSAGRAFVMKSRAGG